MQFPRYSISISLIIGILFGGGFADILKGNNINLDEALQFLREYELNASNVCFHVRNAQWKYSTNMTDFNKRRMIEEQMLKAKFDKLSWMKAVSFNWSRLPDPMVRRQLKLLILWGRASLPDDKYNEIHYLISEMKEIYNNVRICPYNNNENTFCDVVLDPDIFNLMANSRNPDELAHIWKEWHDKTGALMKNTFMRYVQLANQAANLNGFKDSGEQMRYQYEDKQFEFELEESWQNILPLYKELFTYARKTLIDKYGMKYIRPDGPIPIHLLGNIWGQDWSHIADLLTPYPAIKNLDITEEMLRQGFTSSQIFRMVEEFFTSMGMKSLPPEFWRYSLFDKPTDRKIQCTASAWDFCNKIDYRIKQCTEVNMENFVHSHHEMAHIQYYMQYIDQPLVYRDGANPGFHEAVSNAIGLSVYNLEHFFKVGLYNHSYVHEANINFLMMMALKKVAYAPYALLVDRWRFHVYRDGIQTMNSAWWELRLRYQGVVPPLPRSEKHLDAASKKHIISDEPYTKYYVGLVLEFQIYAGLCAASAHKGQLHTCDIYRSTKAGHLLGEALKLGRSRNWREVLRIITQGNDNRLNADPFLEYFKPLLAWLKEQNKDENCIGWTSNENDMSHFQPIQYKSLCNILFSVETTILVFCIAFLVLLRLR